MKNHFVFTDEAGAYNKLPSEPFRRSHPFYIRSNTYLSANDYRVFQGEVQAVDKRYGIPVGEEIKWSDLWETKRGKFRSAFLKGLSEDNLKGYYRKVLQYAATKDSLLFFFTVTCVFTQPCYHSESELLKFHLQEAMQRVNMDAQPDDFATIIMDELNPDKIKKLKAACHEIAVTGDLIKYKNIYSGVLTESSSQSPGIQLADFAAGIMNGYLRGALLSRGKYEFATELFNKYIEPNLRRPSQELCKPPKWCRIGAPDRRFNNEWKQKETQPGRAGPAGKNPGTPAGEQHQQHGGYPEPFQGNHRGVHGKRSGS